MAPKTFFTLTLALPVVTFVVAWLIDAGGGVAFLMMAAAPAYIFCAVVLAGWFAFTRTRTQLVVATLLAPVVMAVALMVQFIVEDPKEVPLTVHRVLQLAAVAPYGLVVGGLYVGVAWALYALAERVGVIKHAAAA